ncbi:polysaccharide biosynthesis/export family protein [Jannaschia sp. W003]|uniref:polysaccharide biosynthesis/export family protein n=1 Tax=Jannaschia sp. W003 TaxID=2867012 RepID=UPI0021A86A97|nr:polysaccharide biosynthesis/export family protein [Jannaschia sp. W003]UWQ23209.1 polysaccharide export protein [Jannaschia sp. W003]
MMHRLIARCRASILLALVLLMPAAIASAQGRYVIGAGDVLQVEVLEDESLSRTVLVTPSGEISLPLAGSVQAGGQTLSAVQEMLRQRLAPNFAEPPTVFVALSREAIDPPVIPGPAPTPPAPILLDIFALGEVGNRGQIQVEPGTTILQAFALMGGFTPFAASDRIQLRRRDPITGVERIYPLRYSAIISGRSPNGSARLVDGDVFVVPTRKLFE